MPTLRYFAAAAEAAGTEHEHIPGADVESVVSAVCEAHGSRMRHVMQHSSLLVGGRYVSDPATVLEEDAVVDVLPPFAGG